VTANLYRPAKPQASGMPGIMIIHSHHNPKEQGELQDMGVTWARAGCYVLIPDQLGHGERRQHPFVDAKSYPEPFKVGRQDYFFRYNLGVQLSLIGESLIGWMAWDLMRGVDLLLKKPGIDKEKIILLGSVAGGGDPAAVTAALDPRIKCVVPFNFGGPQPETKPLGADAETTFNYAGSGSWESTRNLRNSARDGFVPWVIVASTAPRYIIHAHEFSWYGDRDPVYKRYQKIWGFYDAKDRVSFTHGFGTLTSKDPVGSHCNNIGPEHRKLIHQAFEKWFGIKAVETKDRHKAEELHCWTEEARKELKPKSIYELAPAICQQKLNEALLAIVFPKERWRESLGVDPRWKAKRVTETGTEKIGNVSLISLDIAVERDIHVPALLLLPVIDKSAAVVVAFAQEGKARLLKDRSEAISRLLARGVAVCLADLRGMGETRLGSGRGRASSATSISSSEQMLGGTIIGEQLRDLSAVLDYLATHKGINGRRIGLWGESFAEFNEPGTRLDVPHDADRFPLIGEPNAGLIAMIAGQDRPEIKACLVRGSVVSLSAGIDSPFYYLPHDAGIPGAIAELNTSLVLVCALRIERPIDGRNRPLAKEKARLFMSLVLELANGKLSDREAEMSLNYSSDAAVAEWFAKQLKP
jgi:dienelactone hydrolase